VYGKGEGKSDGAGVRLWGRDLGGCRARGGVGFVFVRNDGTAEDGRLGNVVGTFSPLDLHSQRAVAWPTAGAASKSLRALRPRPLHIIAQQGEQAARAFGSTKTRAQPESRQADKNQVRQVCDRKIHTDVHSQSTVQLGRRTRIKYHRCVLNKYKTGTITIDHKPGRRTRTKYRRYMIDRYTQVQSQ